DDFRVHVVVGETGGAAGDAVHPQDFIIAAVGHAVMVFEDQENNRQAGFAPGGQVVGELRLRGEIQGFQHHTVGVRAVTGKTANHVAALQIAVGQSRAGGNGHAAADDSVGAK